MKNTRRVKMERTYTGDARTQKGIPVDMRAQMAYWGAYIAFLERMSEDPRFVLVSEYMGGEL